jgi:hypothetical protein
VARIESAEHVQLPAFPLRRRQLASLVEQGPVGRHRVLCLLRPRAAGGLRADFVPEDLVLMLMANAGLVHRTADAARMPGNVSRTWPWTACGRPGPPPPSAAPTGRRSAVPCAAAAPTSARLTRALYRSREGLAG